MKSTATIIAITATRKVDSTTFAMPILRNVVAYFGHHLEYIKEVTDQASEVLRTLQSAWLGWRHNEIFDPDRKPSQANARSVPHCIRDRAGRAGDADFTDTLDAKCVHVRILFLD